ncbi:MAG TPA: hypothetical protein DD640_06170 [Clostridiales bacterium]|nr:hypothetical protein [Clostridiales bacterium]
MAVWQCPNCGREFTRRNTKHSCGEPLETIDAYIAAQPEPVQNYLNQVRDTIRAALPDVQECLSWRMPTYWHRQNIIHFAAFKNHLGIYPGSEAIEHFRDRLAPYAFSKGAVQLPYNQPLPLDLITEIAQWCYQRAVNPS